jgi:hypothetical protein
MFRPNANPRVVGAQLAKGFAKRIEHREIAHDQRQCGGEMVLLDGHVGFEHGASVRKKLEHSSVNIGGYLRHPR